MNNTEIEVYDDSLDADFLKRRIIHALLTQDFRHVKNIKDNELGDDEEKQLYERILESRITYNDLRNFLLYIGRPDEQGQSFDEIYFIIAKDKDREKLRILESFVDFRYFKGGTAVKEFIRIFPTRMDFEDAGHEWLNKIIGIRRKTLIPVMNDFLLNVYGEQDLYFRILKELYTQAGEYGAKIDLVEISGGKDVNGDGVLDEILSGRIRMEDMGVWDVQADERALVEAYNKRINAIWLRIVEGQNARVLQIMAQLSGLGWNNYLRVDSSTVGTLLKKYPGRGMLENDGVKLLSLIRNVEQRQKYSDAMLELVGALYT